MQVPIFKIFVGWRPRQVPKVLVFSAQREHCPICTARSGNVRHRCRGSWAKPRLFLGGYIRGVCEPVSGIQMQSLVGLSAHSAFHWWSAHCTYVVVVVRKTDELLCSGYNGCLDLRRLAAAPDGRVKNNLITISHHLNDCRNSCHSEGFYKLMQLHCLIFETRCLN